MDFHSPLIGRPRPKVDGLEESLQNLIRRSVGMARDGVMMWPSCYRQDAVTLRFGGILFFLGGGLGWVKVGGDWEWTCSLLTLKKNTSDIFGDFDEGEFVSLFFSHLMILSMIWCGFSWWSCHLVTCSTLRLLIPVTQTDSVGQHHPRGWV